jgi:putative membrane protein
MGLAETAEAANEKSLAKGLIAGLIGGLIGTAAKTFAERMFPPRTYGEPEPPELLADRVAGHELAREEKTAVSEAIHWGFGGTVGAAYGVIAEYYPAATAKGGASFGVALGTLTHEKALPALGLSAETEEQTVREKTSELTTHVVYGVVTETVRSLVRRML